MNETNEAKLEEMIYDVIRSMIILNETRTNHHCLSLIVDSICIEIQREKRRISKI